MSDPGATTVSHDPASRVAASRYAVDGVIPARVVVPEHEEGVAAALDDAIRSGAAAIAVGAGTQLDLGNPPERYDVALDLRRLSALVAHDPPDMTVTVQPAVALAALQEALAHHNQFLPLDPPLPSTATVGGVVATNAFGPWRHAYGTARDWVIGMRMVLGTGTVTKSGGRVVKNVTGYDLHKLHIGALGTLGVITEVTFKLAPLPRASRSVAVRVDTPHDGVALILGAQTRGMAVTAAELLSPSAARGVFGDKRWTVLFRLAGGEAAVERTLRDIPDLAPAAGSIEDVPEDTWQRWAREMHAAPLAMTLSVRPSRLGPALAALEDTDLCEAALSATVGAGYVRVAAQGGEGVFGPLYDAAARVAAERSGRVVVVRAPVASKGAIDVFGAPRADLAIMRRIKQEYDPHRVLAPGRFYGHI